MKYEEAKAVSANDFKRLSGVYPETFSEMVEIVQKNQVNKKVSGRPSKLSLSMNEEGRILSICTWKLQIGGAFTIIASRDRK